MKTFTYIEGQSLPDLAFWITEDKQLLNLSSGYTFTLEVGTGWQTDSPGFTKSGDMTGAVGAGTEPNGTPNLVIAWTSTDLPTLVADTYSATLRMVRNADSKPDKRQFTLQIVPEVS